MTWTPRVTVAAVIERNNRYLLVQERVGGKLVYNQPAGHLEDGESLVAAVIRETLEETAWHIQPSGLVGIYRWRQPLTGDTYLRVTFSASCLYHDSGRPLDKDIERTVWLAAKEIYHHPERLRSPLVTHAIDDYLSGITYPLTLLADIE